MLVKLLRNHASSFNISASDNHFVLFAIAPVCFHIRSASETESVTVYGYDPKKPMCCKKLFDDEPKEKIINCYIFRETRKCLRSVLFIDVKMKKHCINPSASWLGEKIKLLEMQQNDGVKCEDYRKPTWPWTS
ncbi:hypothetical protein DNTS_032017 [Danionella cerebrum]|uniref:Chemokine interleukin-8-like domain-containing protein n=1 Tax=Danionella cerebrum TaxID=2873325 RepID=A0A553Q392_9TELE|nr:hypothetical protein DNTS_032017 [Danionella translucida]